MQEGSAAKGAAVCQRRRALCRVEHKLNLAVGDGIHDMRAPFQYLVDLAGRNALFREIALRPGSCDDLEAETDEKPDGFDHARLVVVLDRDKDCPRSRQSRAAPDLALGEGD